MTRIILTHEEPNVRVSFQPKITMSQQVQFPSFGQCYAFVHRIMPYSAVSVLVCLRSDLGYRLISPLSLIATFGVVAILTILATPGHEAGRPQDLLIFCGIALANGLTQRFRKWRQLNRNDIQSHSYYIGSSPFAFAWLPNFMRHNRRVARYCDPLFFALIGLALLPFSRFLALYLVFGGFCVRAVEHMTWEKERNRGLDMVDSLIISGQQAQKMDQYEQAPAAEQQSADAIPTGISPDLEKKIKFTKTKNPSLN